MTLEKLKKLVEENPELDLLGTLGKSAEQSIASRDAEKAAKRLEPVCAEIQKFLTGLVAAGKMEVTDVPKIKLGTVEDEKEGTVVTVKATVKKGSRASSNGSAAQRFKEDDWTEIGFQAFVVGGTDHDKPKDAIEAAGGELKSYTCNYWHFIFDGAYKDLDIQVRIESGGKPDILSLADAKVLLS